MTEFIDVNGEQYELEYDDELELNSDNSTFCMKVRFHPLFFEDLNRLPQEHLDSLMRALDEGDFSDPEPLDLEKMKKEEPELYEELMRRHEDLQ